ncbi:DUF4174 domain-containing protein [Rhizobium sp. LEGMi198b]
MTEAGHDPRDELAGTRRAADGFIFLTPHGLIFTQQHWAALPQGEFPMLRSLFREFAGAGGKLDDPCPSLASFRNRCNVLVIFEDSNDDRPIRQEEELLHHEKNLTDRNVTVLRVAGGGVFQLFEEPYELNADDIRRDLQGPENDEFEMVLVGTDGMTKLRSYAPLPTVVILDVLDALPPSIS